jgi:hypothetical protein
MTMFQVRREFPPNLSLSMNKRSVKIIIFLSFFILFSAFFYLYFSVKLWDIDFWWHTATGKYIVTERHLPEKDPFSFTSLMEENKNIFPERENFILKQYWLAQVLFYIIFTNTGPTGIILLRSAILLITILIVFWRFQRSGVSFYISFAFVFLLFMMSTKSVGERPVLFSILFTAVLLFLLEDFVDRKNKTLFLLVPVMLLWSNMHGGFIIGIIIISVFMFVETVKIFFKKSNLTKREMRVFYIATGLSIIASFMNPTGWEAFSIAFSSKYDIFLTGINEYQSPVFLYVNKIHTFDYAYFTLVLMFPAILIFRNRKIGLTHLILLAGFFIMSLRASRYGIFYAVAGSMIMGKEFNVFINATVKKRVPENLQKKIGYVLAVVALISSSFFIIGYFKHVKYENQRFGPINFGTIPVPAVNFIERNRIKGNMFNDYGYGGYIAWRLYPQKNFIDTRALNMTVMNEYEWTVEAREKVEGIKTTNDKIPLWETILNHYKVNFVFIPLMDLYGNVFPLALELIENEKWVPVYLDHICVIFVRHKVENSDIISKYKITKDFVYNALITKYAASALNDRINPRYVISLGYIFSKLGRHEDALKAYRYAFERWKDPELEKKIKKMDTEFNKQDKLLNKNTDKK